MSGSSAESSGAASNSLRVVRSLVMPTEHGSWSFLLEPAMLGILAVPSIAGGLVVVAGLAAFLTRRPIRVWLDDRRRQRVLQRTTWAGRIVVLLAAMAAVFCAASAFAGGWHAWIPAALGGPLAALAVWLETSGRGREAGVEAIGVIALAALSPAVMLAGGAPALPSGVACALVLLRALPALAYVRTRLRLDKGQPAHPGFAILAHGAACVCAAGLVGLGACRWWLLLPVLALFARCGVGLAPGRPRVRAQRIGAEEAIFGVLSMAAFAAAIVIP